MKSSGVCVCESSSSDLVHCTTPPAKIPAPSNSSFCLLRNMHPCHATHTWCHCMYSSYPHFHSTQAQDRVRAWIGTRRLTAALPSAGHPPPQRRSSSDVCRALAAIVGRSHVRDDAIHYKKEIWSSGLVLVSREPVVRCLTSLRIRARGAPCTACEAFFFLTATEISFL